MRLNSAGISSDVTSNKFLFKANDNFEQEPKNSNRRARNYEVDFVIERKGKVIGLEVKSDAAGSTSGMTAF